MTDLKEVCIKDEPLETLPPVCSEIDAESSFKLELVDSHLESGNKDLRKDRCNNFHASSNISCDNKDGSSELISFKDSVKFESTAEKQNLESDSYVCEPTEFVKVSLADEEDDKPCIFPFDDDTQLPEPGKKQLNKKCKTKRGRKKGSCYKKKKNCKNVNVANEAEIFDYLVCKVCFMPFREKIDYENHVESHGLGKSDDGEVEIKCSECGKQFSSKKLLNRHVIIHSTERPYSCDSCDKSFKRQYELTKHKRKHTGSKLLSCDVCDYSTIYPSAFSAHRMRHSKKFKYTCEICGKGFFAKTWLQEHHNFHTGEKPFQCELCGKAFPYTRYLVAHKKTTHPDRTIPSNIHKCETCGRIFAHKKSLQKHLKFHTGENVCLCDICGKALSSKEHLKFHRRTHTGEKPNICDICGKGFAKSDTLISHVRTHTGEKPYGCEVCGKSFSQRSTLVIHRRYHTGERPYSCNLCKKGFVCQALLTMHRKTNCMPY